MSALTKYPLIEDTDKTRERKTLETSSLSTSKSDYKTLSTMFPNSPIYSETNDTYRVTAKAYLSTPGPEGATLQEGDPNQFPDGVDLNYGKAPELPTDQSEYEGNYYPKLVVGELNEDGTSAGSTITPNDNFGFGAVAGTTTGPKASSTLLSQTDTISKTAIGAVSGQSFAHSEFPGALKVPT